MFKTLQILPDGWKCCLKDCPYGPFVFGETLGFKSEYNEPINVFVVESGEAFWGGTKNDIDRDHLSVQPCKIEWVVIE